MKTQLEKYRDHAFTCADHLQKAMAANDKAQREFVEFLCRTYNVKKNYIALLEAVVADPLHGAYRHEFFGILSRAIQKGFVQHVSGGLRTIRRDGSSGNAWHELGANGEQLMRDLKGPGWVYPRPGTQTPAVHTYARADLEKAISEVRINHLPVPQAFSYAGYNMRDGLSYEAFEKQWNEMSLETRIGKISCLIGAMSVFSECNRLITRAYEDLCRHGKLQYAPEAVADSFSSPQP